MITSAPRARTSSLRTSAQVPRWRQAVSLLLIPLLVVIAVATRISRCSRRRIIILSGSLFLLGVLCFMLAGPLPVSPRTPLAALTLAPHQRLELVVDRPLARQLGQHPGMFCPSADGPQVEPLTYSGQADNLGITSYRYQASFFSNQRPIVGVACTLTNDYGPIGSIQLRYK